MKPETDLINAATSVLLASVLGGITLFAVGFFIGWLVRGAW